MAEVYDADGNLVEGYLSPEEVTAKLDAEKIAWEAANPPAPVVVPPVAAPAADAPPAWAQSIIDKVEQLSGNQKSTLVKDFTSGLDADKQKEFDAKFNSLSGYEETPEGIQKRAQDAYLLTTGQQYSATPINMQNIAASTGGPVRPAASAPAIDKELGAIFGNTEDDISKYGKK